MTITIDWSWTAFIVGSIFGIILSVMALFVIAFKQWSKNKKASDKATADWWASLEDWQKENEKKSRGR